MSDNVKQQQQTSMMMLQQQMQSQQQQQIALMTIVERFLNRDNAYLLKNVLDMFSGCYVTIV